MCVVWKRPNTRSCVVSGCKISLDEKRYNWRHDSILSHIANCLSKYKDLLVYCDIGTFKSPRIITGDAYRPDIVIKNENMLVILKLTAGYETNIKKNSIRKHNHYKQLINELGREYSIRFINLSMGAIGVIGEDSKNMKSVFSEIGVANTEIIG